MPNGWNGRFRALMVLAGCAIMASPGQAEPEAQPELPIYRGEDRINAAVKVDYAITTFARTYRIWSKPVGYSKDSAHAGDPDRMELEMAYFVIDDDPFQLQP